MFETPEFILWHCSQKKRIASPACFLPRATWKWSRIGLMRGLQRHRFYSHVFIYPCGYINHLTGRAFKSQSTRNIWLSVFHLPPECYQAVRFCEVEYWDTPVVTALLCMNYLESNTRRVTQARKDRNCPLLWCFRCSSGWWDAGDSSHFALNSHCVYRSPCHTRASCQDLFHIQEKEIEILSLNHLNCCYNIPKRKMVAT